MVDREEYFPRGKEPPHVAKVDGVGDGVSGKGNNGEKQAQLENKTNNQEKPLEAKLEDKETLAGNRKEVEEKKFAVVPLTYDQIMEGMLSIGIVSRIRDHDMYISLPGRTGGTVSINNISTPYLKIMEKYEGQKPSTEDEICFYSLKELFQIGQQVVVKVAKVERSETSTKIYLTMNPQDLHEFYSTAVLEEDLVLIAAVQSKEDHGYVMDVGIAGVRCFLPKADADEYIEANQNRPLGIGQLMYCKIKKSEVHSDRLDDNIIVTVMPTELRRQKMEEITTLNYSALIPGMLVDAVVMETNKTGIVVRCMDFNGLIYQDHMSESWTSPETLEIGSTVPARVLYILPNLTSPYLTLQTDLLPLAQTGDRTDFKKLGAKLEVTVVGIEKRGVIVRFEDDDKGLIPINHIGHETLLRVKFKDISKKYPKNSTHPCRVLQYIPVERMYLCSFKKEMLTNDIFHIQQASCGKVVSCKIIGWNMEGVRVQVGSAIQGYIPDSLDKRNSCLDSKEKLIGTTIKARIMQRDIEQNTLVLTAHKELVTSNGVVLTSVDEAEVGMKGHAIIKTIDKTGAYVNTIGGVEGLIPRAELIRIGLAGFAESIIPGQIIKYKVLEKNNEKNQLVLSAIIKGKEFNTEYLENMKDPEFWKAAVSHYSVLGHLDKARRVAKQALDTIDYRKVKGKREVWGSLLQLEMKYGTEETVNKTYAEALEQSDEFEWLKLAAKVYDQQNRPKDAERIYREMTKKFLLEPEAWIRFGKFNFFKQNFDGGREVLHQALINVPEPKRLLVITNFALLEMHHGDQSKGEQMLDRVLEQHPQRSDLWLVYANGLIKVGDYDKARNVFQRSIENNWSPRKVEPLLQRYRELENDHGNESTKVEFHHYVDALKEKIKDEEEYSEVVPQKGRQGKRKLSSNSESDSQEENDESKKEKRKKNKKMKSVPETGNDDSEFDPEANEMEVDMKTESSDLKEGGEDESVSDSDEEPDQSKSKKKKKSDAAVADVPETVGEFPASKLNRARLADFKEAHHVGQNIQYKVREKNHKKHNLVMAAVIEDEEKDRAGAPSVLVVLLAVVSRPPEELTMDELVERYADAESSQERAARREIGLMMSSTPDMSAEIPSAASTGRGRFRERGASTPSAQTVEVGGGHGKPIGSLASPAVPTTQSQFGDTMDVPLVRKQVDLQTVTEGSQNEAKAVKRIEKSWSTGSAATGAIAASGAVTATACLASTSTKRWKIPEEDLPTISRIGAKGTKIEVGTNYIRLRVAEGLPGVVEYHVAYSEPLESVSLRKKSLWQFEDKLGQSRFFDGTTLFLPFILDEDVTVLHGMHPVESTELTVYITFVKAKANILPFFEVLLRRIMVHLELVEIGNEFYDLELVQIMDKQKLQVWPGMIVTAKEEAEGGLRINVGTCSLILQTDTVFDYFISLKGDPKLKEKFNHFVINKIVLTKYDNMPYRIDDVAWDMTPATEFKHKMSFETFLKMQYNQTVKFMNQPMLISKLKPRKNERMGGETTQRMAVLVPELCYLTGQDNLTEDQRANFKVMTDLAESEQGVNQFMQQLYGSERVKEILGEWNLEVSPKTVLVEGRKIDGAQFPFNRRSNAVKVGPDFSREAGLDVYDKVALQNDVEMPPDLPLEVWEGVLGFLPPKEFHSAINASPVWNRLMMSEHTSNLFPLVLPNLAEYLDSERIMGCRVVNRACKRAVDELLTENIGCWGKRQPVTTKMGSMIESIRAQHYVFGSEEIIRSFMRHMLLPTHRPHPNDNPFITGSIFLLLWHSREEDQEHIIEMFLSRFGNHIRSLAFYDASFRRQPPLETLLWMLGLQYLPNLKSLKIHGGALMRTELERPLDVLDVPLLESIEELYLDPKFPESMTEPALKFLRRWELTLRALSVGSWFLESQIATASVLYNSVPRLKWIEVSGIGRIGLCKLAQVQWRLEELQLKDVCFRSTDTTTLIYLLQAVISFAEVLETLKLFLWNENTRIQESGDEDDVLLLEKEMMPMAKLKHLTLDFACLKLRWAWRFFQLSCQLVEELSLYLYEDIAPKKEDMLVIFHRAFDILLRLKKITVFSRLNTKKSVLRHSFSDQ
ncbi:unnamed protein product [Orchesella dallaii]|uniref:Protein RRP5 n=1 Tax=Orchesella dallaii TaxID=48710 RepID=A0ABP1PV04_9HEXA